MFNIGFTELLTIGVIALVFIGPKQLPQMAKVLGRLMGEFRKATADLSGGLLEVRKDFDSALEGVPKNIDDVMEMAEIDEEKSDINDQEETAQAESEDSQELGEESGKPEKT